MSATLEVPEEVIARFERAAAERGITAKAMMAETLATFEFPAPVRIRRGVDWCCQVLVVPAVD